MRLIEIGPLLFVGVTKRYVLIPRVLKVVLLGGGDVTHYFTGHAEDERVWGDMHLFGHQSAGANNAVGANMRATQDHGANPDERAILNCTPVHDSAMADRDVITNDGRAAVVDVDDGAVLNTRVLAYHDGGEVAPQNRAKPDAAVRAHSHIAHQGRGVGDKGGRVDMTRREGIIKGKRRFHLHGALRFGFFGRLGFRLGFFGCG